MSEEPAKDAAESTSTSSAPTHYKQDPLFTPPRSEMKHLTDQEYEQLKAELGEVGTEHNEKYSTSGEDREALMERLGMTASGRTVSVRLFPASMSRGDVDTRGSTIWKELSEIHHLGRELDRAKAARPTDIALLRLLDPMTRGGEAHPNEIGEGFMGSPRSKGRPGRAAAFGDAMQLVQHGTPEQRHALIEDMKRRLAEAKGEPVDPAVTIAKQLVLDGMPPDPEESDGQNGK